MKATKHYLGNEEGFKTIGRLWKTDLFWDCWRVSEWSIEEVPKKYQEILLIELFRIVRKQARPFITYEATDPIERSHFTSWMGFIQLREYDNDLISDLYYLHEILHLATLDYFQGANDTFNLAKFHRDQCYNELGVASYTEAFVYHDLVTLDTKVRDKSFPFEIWVDGLVRGCTSIADVYAWDSNLAIGSLGLEEPQMDNQKPFMSRLPFFKSVIDLRVQTLRNPNPFSLLDIQVAEYAKMNYEWTKIWQHNAHTVIKMMWKLHAKAQAGELTKEDLVAHEQAMYEHDNELLRKTWTDGSEHPIPFTKEAIEFAGILAANTKAVSNRAMENK